MLPTKLRRESSKNSISHVDASELVTTNKLEAGSSIELDTTTPAPGAVTDLYGQAIVQIDPVAAKKLRRKIDLYVIPNVAMLYLWCFIDRANIGNARIAGMVPDLKLVGFDYNIILTAFAVGYLVFEIPSTMICKKVGPGWFLPGTTIGFGVMSILTAFVQTKAQMAALRFLLSIFEAGLLPCLAYYLSRWYTRAELPSRIACYIVCNPIAGAFGGLLASGILTRESIGSVKGWRMLFLVEGVITTGVGLICLATVTDRPETARWLNAEEKELAVKRIMVERVSTTEVLDRIDWYKIRRGISSPITIGTAIVFGLTTIPVTALSFFLPTIIASLYPGRTVVQQQLLSVPPYVAGMVTAIAVPMLSWRLDRRNRFFFVILPTLMTGYLIFLCTRNVTARYAALFIIGVALFTQASLQQGQISANVVSDTARAAALGTGVFVSNIGSLISTWTFLQSNAPSYNIGNGINFAALGAALLVCIAMEVFMRRDNKRREALDPKVALAGLSTKQIQDLDWKHPGFRWKP